jgi:hypothetical protein
MHWSAEFSAEKEFVTFSKMDKKYEFEAPKFCDFSNQEVNDPEADRWFGIFVKPFILKKTRETLLSKVLLEQNFMLWYIRLYSS